MTRRTALAAILLGTFPLTRLHAQDPPRWHFKAGDRFFVQWHSLKNSTGGRGGLPFQSQEAVTVVLRLTVLQVNGDGGVILEERVESVKDDVIGGQADILPGLIQGAVVRATLDGSMNVVRVEGAGPAVKRLWGDDTGPKADLVRAAVEDQCREWLHDVFFPLPADKLQRGEPWEQQTRLGIMSFGHILRKKAFTPAGEDVIAGDKVCKIAVRSADTFEPLAQDEPAAAIKHTKAELHKSDYRGTLYFDPAAGRLRRAEMRWWKRMTVSFDLQGRTFESYGDEDITTNVRVLDEDPLAPPPGAPAAAPATPAAKEITNSLGMKLVLIPAGKFRMGSPPLEQDRIEGEDLHEVEMTRPFYMGAHEVTIGKFREFVQATGYRTDCERSGRGAFGFDAAAGTVKCNVVFSWKNPGWEHTDEHPAVNLSWNDATAFCNWLSRKEGKTYRLPTEAEWEYACRAGTQTRFHSGDDAESLAKFANVPDASSARYFPQWRSLHADDGYAFTAPVGSFRPNAFGLYDMHGNALEWCADWAWRYDAAAQRDPKGPPVGRGRVQRGGSWADFPDQCRSASRTNYDAGAWCISSGFRVVLEAR
jgi:formylglycine-generating enzyme required for sulfatase activity